MRVSALMIVGLGFAGFAAADCTDTLYLQSIEAYRQTVRNDTVLGGWTKTVVNPWDLLDLGNAARPAAPMTGFGADTMFHYLRFSSNCGSDSISNVLVARVIDSTVRTGGAYVPKIKVDTFQKAMKVERMGDGAQQVTFEGHVMDFYWESSAFQVAKLQDSTGIVAWFGDMKSYRYLPGGSVSASRYWLPTEPVRELAQSTLSSGLQGLASDVRSIRSKIDSIRSDLVLFRYLFTTGNPLTAIRRPAGHNSRLSAFATSSGWDIRLGSVGSARIVSPEGKVARTFAPASSVAWDGKDAAGRKLTGMWIVSAPGLGALPILLK